MVSPLFLSTLGTFSRESAALNVEVHCEGSLVRNAEAVGKYSISSQQLVLLIHYQLAIWVERVRRKILGSMIAIATGENPTVQAKRLASRNRKEPDSVESHFFAPFETVVIATCLPFRSPI
jgi:hypothetical protein